ncbi:GNAT family N-acetyltransferase [Microbacterium indicum]|uniref:GNAT family N-acetyltransferase n=1 Tax=Microbacterium indicum TaxID=358100 RepID=UPI00041DC087|nr:GNAT family N-acetyltransferase [Microbacterium indicum]
MRVDLFDGAAAIDRGDEIWAVYQAVFGDAPDRDEWLGGLLRRHARRDEFRLAASYADDAMIGFAYGYRGARGQYYTDSVREALGPDADLWTPGFEFVQFGVIPQHRRTGVGGALYDAVFRGVRGAALLSTWDDDADPAVVFYRARGWRRLATHPSYDGTRVMQIMGRTVDP